MRHPRVPVPKFRVVSLSPIFAARDRVDCKLKSHMPSTPLLRPPAGRYRITRISQCEASAAKKAEADWLLNSAPDTVAVAAHFAVKGLFNGPIIGVLYIVGTAAWTLGAGAIAYTLWRAGAPLARVLLITAAGLLLFADHTPPFGPGAVALALGLQGWQSTATIKEKRA